MKLSDLLVDDWRCLARWWSVRLHALALLWVALYELAPVLPPEVTAMVPSPLRPQVIGAYSVLGILARLVAQRAAPR